MTNSNSREKKRKADDQTAELPKAKRTKLNPTNPSIPIKICTWNINHISPHNKNLEQKLERLVSILTHIKPDLLVLQEVNVPFDNQYFIQKIEQLGYNVRWGPHLKTTASDYTPGKNGLQNEYYPVFYLKEIEIFNTFVIENKIHTNKESRTPRPIENEFDKNPKDGTELAELAEIGWIYHRPVVMRRVKKDGITFIVGVVHTSPSYKVQISARDYIEGTLQTTDEEPWILAGDWYVKEEDTITSNGTKKTWANFLKEKKCQFVKPNNVGQTNFPSNGQGMIADYFVVSSQVDNKDIYALINPADENQLMRWQQTRSSTRSTINQTDVNKAVRDRWTSDHIPVVATLAVNLNSNTATTQSIFPSQGLSFTYALSSEPILLNGMKVIFDQPVGVYPVTLEPKDKEHPNGSRY